MSPDHADERERGVVERVSRRSVVATAAGTVLASVGVFGGSGAASEDAIDRRTTTLGGGTEYETEAYVGESDRSGPTAVVVGGLHGDEPSGYEAAHRVADWSFDRGTLVVLPEANAAAVERGTRESSDGDLNRQFPTNRRPEWPIATEIWDLITGHDADVVIDLHSARGIWGSDRGPDGSYGQAIFPSAAGDSRSVADRVASAMNEHHVDDSYPSDYEFEVGNTLTGDRPLLVHKVAGDLERPGYLTEVTRHETELETRIEWNQAMVARILRHHGIEPSYANDS